MITVNELREVLRSIGFVEKNDVFSNSYSSGASIDVNFEEKKIIYSPVDEDFKEGLFPTKEKQANGFVIHRDTTLNFNANENFVCLICVHFLLKKGYEAKHIVFEPAFKVGHVNKPSYGDILVFDKEYNPLVLIENKTFGTEFSKEWNLMQKDGGQLFSYLGPLVNEMGLCENLALFAADFDDIDIIPKSHIITLRDNEKRIAELENPKTFADAKGKYFEVWNETYAKSFETKNDLLTVRSNGSQELVGRFMIVNKDLKEKTTFSGFTIRVRPDNEVVKSEFLYYILSSPIIRKQLVVGSNGSNIKSLNQTLLANVEISIPSMKKQEEILSELLDIEKQIIEQRSIIEFGQDKKNRIIEDELV